VFYFRPGHETYPSYHDANVQRVIANAVAWAHNPAPRFARVTHAPNRPLSAALEPLTERGPRLHHDGHEGFR
jgi:trehalose utilization protein